MPTVLLTGASRGIGRATALALAARGWTVIAGVRSAADGEQLRAQDGRIEPIVLDVTSEADIAALDGALPERLDAVVNNAGIVVDGPVEGLALPELRRQLEVNVVGQVAVTQAVLPRLRRHRGRIVFISSVSGRVSTPWTGAYNASKFAIEAIADALRIELRTWAIPVILVEPNSTDTDMWRSALDKVDATEAALSPQHRALYAVQAQGMRRATRVIQRQAVPVELVVQAIERALSDERPRARYPVGLQSKVQLVLSALTPTRVMDALLAKALGVPRAPG